MSTFLSTETCVFNKFGFNLVLWHWQLMWSSSLKDSMLSLLARIWTRISRDQAGKLELVRSFNREIRMVWRPRKYKHVYSEPWNAASSIVMFVILHHPKLSSFFYWESASYQHTWAGQEPTASHYLLLWRSTTICNKRSKGAELNKRILVSK